MPEKKDIFFIKETFRLAKRAEGFTSPNPIVGAVIVKNNRVIARGYHKKAGLPHAEIEAIKKAKESLKGAVLYVNLEPCFHFNRTPPCVDEIIKNKFKRVVISTVDPNPKVKGKSIKKLRESGIEVSVGIFREQAKMLNEVFFKNMRENSVFVVGKAAQSLDGKIATKEGLSKWITGGAARKVAKSLRDKYDCVLVGINTVLKDNPSLDGFKKNLTKVVIDPNLRIPLNCNLIERGSGKLIIFASYIGRNNKNGIPSSDSATRNRQNFSVSSSRDISLRQELPLGADKQLSRKWQSLVDRGVRIFFIKENNGWLPLKKIMQAIHNLDITSLFVEGGGQTLGRFFDEKIIDKAYFFIAPKVIGGRDALSSVGAQGRTEVKNIRYFKNVDITRLDKDILISGYPQY